MPEEIRKVEYYYATVPNRAGQGARLLRAFKDAGVNFLAVHAFPEGPTAQIDFFPENPRAFLRAAEAAGLEVSPPRTAFLLEGEDRVGAVADILEKLGNAKINVTALDAVATSGRYAAILWVRRPNVDKAAGVLGAR